MVEFEGGRGRVLYDAVMGIDNDACWLVKKSRSKYLTYTTKLDSIKLPSIWHSNLITFDAINVVSTSRHDAIFANCSSFDSVYGGKIKWIRRQYNCQRPRDVNDHKYQKFSFYFSFFMHFNLDGRIVRHENLESVEVELMFKIYLITVMMNAGIWWKLNATVLTLILENDILTKWMPSIWNIFNVHAKWYYKHFMDGISNDEIIFGWLYFNLRLIRWFCDFCTQQKRAI